MASDKQNVESQVINYTSLQEKSNKYEQKAVMYDSYQFGIRNVPSLFDQLQQESINNVNYITTDNINTVYQTLQLLYKDELPPKKTAISKSNAPSVYQTPIKPPDQFGNNWGGIE